MMLALETAKKEILSVLDDGLRAGIISEEEHHHEPNGLKMWPNVHKEHQEGVAPPERPMISGSAALTEICQHYMKQVSKDYASYLRAETRASYS